MPRERPNGTDKPVLVLFRHDLRVADNRALSAAADSGRPVIPVFIFDQISPGIRPLGGARRWWLHHSLEALSDSLAGLGAPLVLRHGPQKEIVDNLVTATGATAVYWNRRYDPPASAIDAAMKAALRAREIDAQSFDGQLLHEPTQVKTGAGGPYRVYTPFWKALASGAEPRPPVDAPKSLRRFERTVKGDRLADWKLLPTSPDWAGGLRDAWKPGEADAHRRLQAFLRGPLDGYGDGRDFPADATTSGLSPHLAHGEITPFQIFAALQARAVKAPAADVEKFRKEIVWREFCYHLLVHHPDLAIRNFNSDFDAFEWEADPTAFGRWTAGQTGYPIVDAGLRELWATGVMHNRVRMIAASFLIKDLLIDWRNGERWFWDTLVDAEPASNPANWQWVAGSGADASPYFRIFNPVLQGEKFDPNGDYVRRWVPELGKLPAKWLHRPFEAPKDVLAAAGVKLGQTYPVPVVEHGAARGRAMRSYEAIKGNR